MVFDSAHWSHDFDGNPLIIWTARRSTDSDYPIHPIGGYWVHIRLIMIMRF